MRPLDTRIAKVISDIEGAPTSVVGKRAFAAALKQLSAEAEADLERAEQDMAKAVKISVDEASERFSGVVERAAKRQEEGVQEALDGAFKKLEEAINGIEQSIRESDGKKAESLIDKLRDAIREFDELGRAQHAGLLEELREVIEKAVGGIAIPAPESAPTPKGYKIEWRDSSGHARDAKVTTIE